MTTFLDPCNILRTFYLKLFRKNDAFSFYGLNCHSIFCDSAFSAQNQSREILVVALLFWEPDRLPMHSQIKFFMVFIILRVYILWFVPKNENLDLDVFLSYVRGGDISENHKLLGKIGKNDFLSIIRK